MKYGNFRSLFYLSFFAIFSFVYAAQTPSEPLNAFLTLETYDFNLVITKSFIRAIKHEVICIVSVPIMFQLCTFKADFVADACKMLEDSQKWSVFINDNKTVCVLIPNPYDDKLLMSRGFIQLEHIANDKITDYFSNQDFYVKEGVQLQHDFKNLFSSQKISKRFYLIGHGKTGKRIASLSIEAFTELLDELSLIDTEFLYLVSCFAAGSNLVALQQQQIKTVDRQFTLAKIEFPIVIQATAGAVATIGQEDFKTFFNNLNLFLAEKKRNYYLGRAPTGLTISEVIKPIIGSDPKATDLPSVRFPGTNSFFRAITLDHVAIITDLMVRQLLTQPLFEQLYVPGAKKPAVPFIPISDQVKYILLYPTDCSEIKFVIPDKYPLPLFISKIPGTAQHYIGTVELDITQWETFLKESFLAPFAILEEIAFMHIKSYEFDVHPKAWFIEKVMSKHAHVFGIVVYKPMIEKDPMYVSPKLLYKDTDTNKYYLAFKERLRKPLIGIDWEPISSSLYALWARFIYETTRASAGALYEASGGLEDKTSEEKAFAHFKESMGIPFENLHYDDNDILQAINYLSCKDSDLCSIALILFQDLVKNRRFDLTRQIIDQLIKQDEKKNAKIVLELWRILAKENIEINAAFGAALQGLHSEDIDVRRAAAYIFVDSIEHLDATMSDKLIKTIKMMDPLRISWIVRSISEDKKLTTKQLAMLLDFLIKSVTPYLNFETLVNLENAMFKLISHKNIKISEREINDIVYTLRMSFNIQIQHAGHEEKQQIIKKYIDRARELPIPSLAKKIEQMVKAEKLLP